MDSALGLFSQRVWLDVNEHLPSCDGYVFVIYKDNGVREIGISKFDGEKFDMEGVSHWCYIPPLPSFEEGENGS